MGWGEIPEFSKPVFFTLKKPSDTSNLAPEINRSTSI
jgi:hypothetical protein